VVDACLGPRVGKVDEKNETEDDEEGGADEREVITPKDEERIGDRE